MIKILYAILIGTSIYGCRTKEKSKTTGSTDTPATVDTDSGATSPVDQPQPEAGKEKTEDTRNVEFVDDQKNDDDDFIIAETSTYISGTNLVEVRYLAKELGGKKREFPVEYDAAAKKFNGAIPKDGYFIVNVGERAAIVPPSPGPIKLTFRSYHLQTEKLLNIALEIGIPDLLSTKTLDIGTFSYLGQVLYRSSRRIPELFNLEKDKIKLLVSKLIESNRLVNTGGDSTSLAKSIEEEISKNFAVQVSARKEIISNRVLAGVFSSSKEQAPISVVLQGLGELAENSVNLRSVANEVNYLNALTRIEKIETLPGQVVEDLSINAWRQVVEYDTPDVKDLTKTETLSLKLTSLVTETNQASGEKAAVVDAVFKQRKWRLSDTFKNDDLSVLGGRLLRSTNQVLFTFFGSTRGAPISGMHPVVNLYTRTYKNGYWYGRQEIAKNLSVGNFVLDQYCTEKACFIATYVGEGVLNPPVNGNYYSKYYTQIYILKATGEVVKADKIEGYQFGLLRNQQKDSIDLAILKDRVVTVYAMDVNGNIVPKKTYEGNDFANLYAVNFENNSLVSLQKRQFVTTEAFPAGFWVWKNYFQIDDGPLTEIVTNLQFGQVTGFDLTGKSLTVSVVSAAKPEIEERFKAMVLVYDLTNPAAPVPSFNPMATKVSHKEASTPIEPGDFGACRLEQDYWFIFASVFSVPQEKNYLYGYSEILPATTIAGQNIDNGTYARGAVLDCSYQQALYWLSATATTQSINAMNISESGQFSDPQAVVTRTENERKIISMTTLSDKSGLRSIMGLETDNVFVNSSSTSGYDYSRSSMFMYLFE